MNTRIHITQEESEAVEALHSRFNSYCNILGHLAQYGSLENNLFDKKWEETVELDQKLQQLKNEIDQKYHPEGEWDYFEFDFKTSELIYHHDPAVQ